jgi:hypothetical protein
MGTASGHDLSPGLTHQIPGVAAKALGFKALGFKALGFKAVGCKAAAFKLRNIFT